jgi:hypothetical protein
MAAGALVAAASFVIASRSNSYPPMLVAYVTLGVGVCAATFLPASLVIANWFGTRRGVAMGVTMSGTTAGGMLMTLVASHVIAHGGWRVGYEVLAAPMALVAAPLIWLLVRTRPTDNVGVSVAATAARLPGLEVGEALRTRSFWTILLAKFCFGFYAAGGIVHIITYLCRLRDEPSLRLCDDGEDPDGPVRGSDERTHHAVRRPRDRRSRPGAAVRCGTHRGARVVRHRLWPHLRRAVRAAPTGDG